MDNQSIFKLCSFAMSCLHLTISLLHELDRGEARSVGELQVVPCVDIVEDHLVQGTSTGWIWVLSNVPNKRGAKTNAKQLLGSRNGAFSHVPLIWTIFGVPPQWETSAYLTTNSEIFRNQPHQVQIGCISGLLSHVPIHHLTLRS